ncbi:MAG: hypothetical protein LBB22_01540 [Treponema sp.]|jgi:hypothetical protein|nr:hypothetical protein [Treponema sp.]
MSGVYYWERASDGVNGSEGHISAGGLNLGVIFWAESLLWDGGLSINFVGGGKSQKTAYYITGGDGIPLISEQPEASLGFFELEVLGTFDTFTENLQFFAGGGASILFGMNKLTDTKDTLVETCYLSFGLDIDTGFRLNIGRRLFLLLGADFSCYFFNYLEYLNKETKQKESRVNSFNVGYVMLGAAPYLSIGFNIKVG